MKYLFVSLFIIFIFFGCTGNNTWKVIAEPKITSDASSNNPNFPQSGVLSSISGEIGSGFATNEEDDYYKITLCLLDNSGQYLVQDGSLLFSLTDTSGNILFNQVYNVSKEKFAKVSPYYSYGYDTVNSCFQINVPYKLINKTNDDYGDFKLTFTNANGKVYKKTINKYLPYQLINYSSYYSSSYSQANLKNISVSQINNNIKITISKAGISNTYYNDYQVDVDFTNLDTKKLHIDLTDIVLVMGGKQYSSSDGSSRLMIASPLYPNAAVTKSFTFYEAGGTISNNATLYVTIKAYDTTVQTSDFTLNFNP